jgi:hypothetical protein
MALEELAKDKEGHFFLAALRDIISTFISYRATDTPPFVTHCLQGVSPSLLASGQAWNSSSSRVQKLPVCLADVQTEGTASHQLNSGHKSGEAD